MFPGKRVVVDAVDDGGVGAVGGRRNENALGASGQMRGGLVLRGEDAGAFHRDVDPEILPGQLRGIPLGGHLDLVAAAADRVAIDGHGAGETAMDAVEAKQMGIGLDRAEVVDADYLDVLAAGLGDGPQDVTADAAKTVDSDADCHVSSPSMTVVIPHNALARLRGFF